jgi:hypothetical protein
MPKKITKDKYILFHVEGGIGKNIAATASAKAMKRQFPDHKLIVLASWPECFLNNPYVDRFYKHGVSPYLYEDFIKGKECLIFRHEPYFANEYFQKTHSLPEIFCKINGVEYNNEKPSIVLNPLEEQIGIDFVNSQPKPVLVFQGNGGPPDPHSQFNWLRDIPPDLAQNLIDVLSQVYTVVQLCHKDQMKYKNTITPEMPLRSVFSIIKYSQARLFIDSFAQHCAAGLNQSSTVCWFGTSSKVFGYDLHYNAQANLNFNDYHDVDAIYEQFPIKPASHQMVKEYNVEKLFDIDAILSSLSPEDVKNNNQHP